MRLNQVLLISLILLPGCKGNSSNGYIGGCKSLSYAFSYETTSLGSEQVVYAVFYEGHPTSRYYDSAKGILTLTMPDSTVVKLPYSKGGQYWVDKDGNVTVLSEPFTPGDLMEIKKLCNQSGIDMKSLEDINQLLKKP
jgi:hypothetical protein